MTDESSNKKDDTEHIKLIKIIFFSLIGIVCVRYDVNLIIFLIFIGITGCFDDVKEDTWLFLLFLLFFVVFSWFFHPFFQVHLLFLLFFLPFPIIVSIFDVFKNNLIVNQIEKKMRFESLHI